MREHFFSMFVSRLEKNHLNFAPDFFSLQKLWQIKNKRLTKGKRPKKIYLCFSSRSQTENGGRIIKGLSKAKSQFALT